ncbi:hypothetical protein Tco_0344853 [Tanacetum coccineum]
MSPLAKNILAARAENRPPMLEKDGYDTWQSRMLLYVEGKENREMLLDSILNGSFEYKVVTFPANEAMGIPAETWMFVTGVKQVENLHQVSFDQLYAYLKQNELDANEVRAMKARFPYPLAFIANTYNPPPSYSCYKRNGHYAKECTAKKRVKDSEWFKENMLLAQQQEAGIEIDVNNKIS